MCVQIIIYMSRLMFVGFACSSRVRKVLSKDYTTPKEAQTSLMALTSKLPARVSSEPQALSISYVRIQIMCKLCTIIHRTAWGIKCMHGPLMREVACMAVTYRSESSACMQQCYKAQYSKLVINTTNSYNIPECVYQR